MNPEWWVRFCDAIPRLFRRDPPNLRGRVPVDGWVSDVAVCAVTREPDGKCSAHGRFCPVVRMASEADTRANATQAFHDGLDGWGIRAPTVFEYEALRADWEKNHKPSPAENARRYSKEGGMW